jgi:hypothetical protein
VSSIELLATVLFGLAVLHTFCVKRFATWAHHQPAGSVQSVHAAVVYIESLNFTEPKFVLVVMVVAATRPVVRLAERVISSAARLVPAREGVGFFVAALFLGPLLGSFITEPAAMTLLALLLKRRYFDHGIGTRLAYATLGLLFVNVSVGGTLTHFAAPPVLMVAGKWQWDTAFMLQTFGWRAAATTAFSTALVTGVFWKELNTVPTERETPAPIPLWLTVAHMAFLALIVAFAHHPDVFFGIFMMFLGLTIATRPHQDALKLREGLLVGFFLAGLVTLGSLQAWWLKPLIARLNGRAVLRCHWTHSHHG